MENKPVQNKLKIKVSNSQQNFGKKTSEQIFQKNIKQIIQTEKIVEKKNNAKEDKFFKELEKEEDTESFIYEQVQYTYHEQNIMRIPSHDSNLIFTFPSNPIDEISRQISINEKNLKNPKKNNQNENQIENPLNALNLNNVFKLQRMKSVDSNLNKIERIESALNVPKTTNLDQKFFIKKGYIKLSHLGNLHYLLTNLFSKQKILDINTFLNKEEVSILIEIIKRKYHKIINENLKGYLLIRELQEIVKNTKEKRPEEKYKFVFKKSLKNLKKKIREHYNKLRPKIKFNDFFYNYYFLEVSKKENLSIEHFYHPKSGNKINKTINANYIRLIKKSDLFIKDFFDYTNNHLIVKYQKSIKKKFHKTFSTWDKHYKICEDKDKYLRVVLTNIKNNKKFKIPWSIIEVESAINAVSKLFSNTR